MENALFDITSNRGGLNDHWSRTPDKSFTGLILPDADVHSLHGNFGDMVFQHIPRPWFDIWFSIYKMLQRLITHSTLDYRSIELSILLKNSISYNWKPFGLMRQEELYLNLAHTMSMDAKVLFEKDVEYNTCDIHYKPEALLILMQYMPELVYPFLNEYNAGRDIIINTRQLFANNDIYTTFQLFFAQLNNENRFALSLDFTGIMLLGYVFLWNAEITQRRGLTRQQQEVIATLNLIKQMLQSNLSEFEGIKHYARLAGMSETAFKKNFNTAFGITPHKFWENERLMEAAKMLLSTGATIKSIAFTLGFPDIHSMDKVFKQKYHQTPGEFRQNNGLT